MNNLHFSIVLLVYLLSGCTALPQNVDRTASFALSHPEQTRSGRIFADIINEHSGQSGVALLNENETAFRLRNAMAGVAQKTLDIQYYIWEGDKSGRFLFQRLLEAADRGVRVRVLLDDFTLSTKDIYLADFTSHPNLEIRLFNPFSNRLAKSFGFLTDISRVNHRMHNKIFVMDNTIGILGGRNIADHYFGLSEEYNFRDLDVVAVGPAMQEVSKIFDIFWNSQWSYPISALAKSTVSEKRYHMLREQLYRDVYEGRTAFDFPVDIKIDDMYDQLKDTVPLFDWADIQVLHDLPDKVQGSPDTLHSQASELSSHIHKEFVAEVAYFIPGKKELEQIKGLVESGVKVRILTNSLASNDVLAAHAGYTTYRRRVLDAGVQLFEFQPDALDRQYWSEQAQEAESRLHTKTFVIDRRYAFIGSFNFDPRSVMLNTEIGLLIDSEEFSEKVLNYLDSGIEQGNSYRLFYEGRGKNIQWSEKHSQKETIYPADPHSTWWQRLKSRFIRLLPIESQL